MKKRCLSLPGILVLSMVLLCFHLGTAAADLNDGLVALYPFNGNANDATGYGHHGTPFGVTPTTDRYGNPNSAYWFDGADDYIDVPYDPEIEPPFFSISLWIKTEMTTQGCIINSDPDGASTHHGYHIWVDDEPPNPYPPGTLVFYVDHNTGPWTPDSNNVYSDNALNDNLWHHIVVTYGGVSAIYVNGDLHDLGVEKEYPRTGASIRIGMQRYDYSPPKYHYYHGKIDDIRIYNRVLEEDEIDLLGCQDEDGDGYATDGGGCGPVDCDDTNPDMNPGETEGPVGDPTCTDGIDNDCNGLFDDISPDPGCIECFISTVM